VKVRSQLTVMPGTEALAVGVAVVHGERVCSNEDLIRTLRLNSGQGRP